VVSTVPDREGRFDFGALTISEDEDFLGIECFALSEADRGLEGDLLFE
jgi:hypothetical protein